MEDVTELFESDAASSTVTKSAAEGGRRMM